MAGIVFVLYHNFRAQSAIHVHAFANYMSQRGHKCVVAVPDDKASVKVVGERLYEAVEFSDLLELPFRFGMKRGPDIVHSWTPREIVRTFCSRLQERWRFKLVLHLEDNEDYLLETALQKDIAHLRAMAKHELDPLIKAHLSHPRKYLDFLKQAEGITIIIRKLREFVPFGVPWCEIWPGADGERFYPKENNRGLRRTLTIPAENTVIVYAGNVHEANLREIRSLYVAVGILNREGHPTTLVRAGTDYTHILEPDVATITSHVINLGYVKHTKLPQVYGLADLFVQPGRPNHFNDYRFPAKIPELFAMGRPVILPKTNVGIYAKHGEDAFVLPVADAVGIAGAVRTIMHDRKLYQGLSEGARRFFSRHLRWETSCEKLHDFYDFILEGKERKEANRKYCFSGNEARGGTEEGSG